MQGIQKFKPLDARLKQYIDLTEQSDIKDIDHYSNSNYEILRAEMNNIKVGIDSSDADEESKKADTWGEYSKDAMVLAEWFDFSQKDIEKNRMVVTNESNIAKEIKSVLWLLPDFDYASYAGLYTIFRFSDYLKMKHDITIVFGIVGNPDLNKIRKEICRIFPNLSNSKIYSIGTSADMCSLPYADATIATLWTTAYMLLKFNKTSKKFYFIQDFEPYFYPAGATFAQALETYKFGFFGISNTKGLKDIYEKDFGGIAVSLNPCVDTHVFYPTNKIRDRKVKKVFFYARPGHPRNGFELGIAALKILKGSMGSAVDIVSAGAEWEPVLYGLEGIVFNLGRLPYENTGDLYRTCGAGLVMMFTKHPSYLPFELMACGCPVVSNYNESTTWFLKDRVNCILTEASATRIAETIEAVLKNEELSEEIRENALKEIKENHADWNSELDRIYQYMNMPYVQK
jgi:glycosyltransferase involved in cell wall biosynthesis